MPYVPAPDMQVCPVCKNRYSHSKDCAQREIEICMAQEFWATVAEAVEARGWVLDGIDGPSMYVPIKWGEQRDPGDESDGVYA